MGAVYKGWQKSLDRFVAIKVLPWVLNDGDADFTARFKREARAMAQLKHNGTDLQRLITKQGRFRRHAGIHGP